MTYTPLSVELPVCPACNHVGKLPSGLFSGKGFCSGPISDPHKRVPMKYRRFVEAPEASRTGSLDTAEGEGRR